MLILWVTKERKNTNLMNWQGSKEYQSNELPRIKGIPI